MEDQAKNGGDKVPVGYRFRPTAGEVLIDYLLNKIHGLPLPVDYAIIDCDLYDGQDRWRQIFAASSTTTESLYFFTKLKKLSSNAHPKLKNKKKKSGNSDTQRFQRRVDGSGTWAGNRRKEIFFTPNLRVGDIRSFAFEAEVGFKFNDPWRYLMDEFHLDPCFFTNRTMDNLVVCHIKRLKPNQEIVDEEL